METIPRRLDDLGKIILPSELIRKLGLTLDPSPRVTITKLDNETLIIQKAKGRKKQNQINNKVGALPLPYYFKDAPYKGYLAKLFLQPMRLCL